MKDLSVVIVNYNVKEYLENALVSVQNAVKNLSSEIFVVDNGSEDGSCKMLKEKFPDVHLIENTYNIGFAKANNKALNQCKGDYVVLINPDTLVQEDTFEKLIAFFRKNKDTGMVGCKILNPDGSLQLACRRSFPTPFTAFSRLVGLSKIFPKSRIFGRYNLTYLDPDEITEVDAVSGSFMMVKKEVIENVGLLDESYFLYGEDLDWCFRIKKAGYKIIYYPETSIIHFKGESSKKAVYEPLKAFYKAMIIFTETHFKGKYLLYPLWFLKWGIWIKAALSLIIKYRKKVLAFFIDLLLINVSFLVSIYIRFGELVSLPPFFDIRSYIFINLICSFIWILLLYGNRIYKKYTFRRLLISVTEGFFIISTLTFFFKDFAFSRLVVLYSVTFIMVLLAGWRMCCMWTSRIFVGKSFGAKNTLIIGNKLDIRQMLEKLKTSEFKIVGIINKDFMSGTIHNNTGIPTGTLEDIDNFTRDLKVTDVLVYSKNLDYDDIITIISYCYERRIDVKIIPSSAEAIFLPEDKVKAVHDISLFDIEYNINKGQNIFYKRFLDLFVSFLILIILLPFYIFSVKFKSLTLKYRFIIGLRKEPVYIKDYYRNGVYYEGWEQYFPKFFLVLKGELSLVGRNIHEEFPLRKGAPLIKPGILDITDYYEDYLYYVKNYNFGTDIGLLTKKLLNCIQG